MQSWMKFLNKQKAFSKEFLKCKTNNLHFWLFCTGDIKKQSLNSTQNWLSNYIENYYIQELDLNKHSNLTFI